MRECVYTHGSVHVEGIIGEMSACSGRKPHEDDERRRDGVGEPLLHDVSTRSRSRAERVSWQSLSSRYTAWNEGKTDKREMYVVYLSGYGEFLVFGVFWVQCSGMRR